jgi:hypothetical protein
MTAYSDGHKARIMAAIGSYYATHDTTAEVLDQRRDEARQAKREARHARGELSEHEEQVLLVQWLEAVGRLYFSVPNGVVFGGMQARDIARYRAYLRSEGLTKGAPDLVIDLGHGRVLLLELKSLKGRVSPEQEALHKAWRESGHRVAVAYGHEDAVRQIEEATKWT